MEKRTLLATLMLASTFLLQGCFPPLFMPRIGHETYYQGYAVPQSTSPWLSLSNGLDLYGWHNCSAYGDSSCSPLQLIAVPAGQKPNWKQLWEHTFPHGVAEVQHYLERPLSAYRNTNSRLLGLSAYRHNRNVSEIYFIKPENPSVNQEKYRGHGFSTVSTVDIWHNASLPRKCLSNNTSLTTRFVLFDDQHLWIFAERDPECDSRPNDYFVPNSLVTLREVNSVDRAMLDKPMQLFYLDYALLKDAHFGMPRRVIRETEKNNGRPSGQVSIAEMTLPKGEFDVDANTFRRDVTLPLRPDQLCRYSKTEVLISGTASVGPVTLGECQPYSEKAAAAIRR